MDQLHSYQIRIEKMRLLVHGDIYRIGINVYIETHTKNCSTCLEFQQTQPKER